jgi:hypothetical protein
MRIAGIVGVALLLVATGVRNEITLHGELRRGEEYSRRFGPGLLFVLRPIEAGWEIVVRDERPDENIARLTPPWHFVPNPRYVEGWHFRNATNTGPNDGSVNAPQRERDFVFSPEVGRRIDYPPSEGDVERVRGFGRGLLVIESLELGNLSTGQRAHIERMRFRVTLSWPRGK